MNAVEIVSYQVEAAKGQISRALNGLDDSALPFRPTEQALSIGEIINHLAEAYQAVITMSAGGKHSWGTFSLKSETLADMVAETLTLREEAAATVLKGDDEGLKLASDFMVAHDNYHVGQLVTTRLGLVPEWNSYEIYGEF